MRRRSTKLDTVPLTVRALTSDGADVRLLLEVDVRSGPLPSELGPERITFALVVPALERWVRQHDLASLTVEVERALGGVAAQFRSELLTLGVHLVRVQVVAVEHLIVSPSGAGARDGHGPD